MGNGGRRSAPATAHVRVLASAQRIVSLEGSLAPTCRCKVQVVSSVKELLESEAKAAKDSWESFKFLFATQESRQSMDEDHTIFQAHIFV